MLLSSNRTPGPLVGGPSQRPFSRDRLLPLHVPHCPYRTIITSPCSTFPFLMRNPKISGSWGSRAPGTSYLCRLFFLTIRSESMSAECFACRFHCRRAAHWVALLAFVCSSCRHQCQVATGSVDNFFRLKDHRVAIFHICTSHTATCEVRRAPKTGCVRNSQRRKTMR